MRKALHRMRDTHRKRQAARKDKWDRINKQFSISQRHRYLLATIRRWLAVLRRVRELRAKEADSKRRSLEKKQALEAHRLEVERRRCQHLEKTLQIYKDVRRRKISTQILKGWIRETRQRGEERGLLATRKERKDKLDQLVSHLIKSAPQAEQGSNKNKKAVIEAETESKNVYTITKDRVMRIPLKKMTKKKNTGSTSERKKHFRPEAANGEVNGNQNQDPRLTLDRKFSSTHATAVQMRDRERVKKSTNKRSQLRPVSPDQGSSTSQAGTAPVFTKSHGHPKFSKKAMEDRALARKQKREELRKVYLMKQARLRAQKQRKIREKEENRVAKSKAERRKRLAKEAKLKKRQQKLDQKRQLAAQKWALACMHSVRATLIFRGWQPWKCLVERARARRSQADTCLSFFTMRRTMSSWKDALNERRLQKEQLAHRFHLAALFLSWRKWQQSEAQSKELAWESRCRSLTKNTFTRWQKAYEHHCEMKRSREEKRLAHADSVRNKMLIKRCLNVWIQRKQMADVEKVKQNRFESLKAKAQSWLSELRQNRKAIAVPELTSDGITLASIDDQCDDVLAFDALDDALDTGFVQKGEKDR